MNRVIVKGYDLREGDVLSENMKPGRTIEAVLPARQRGYLVARFTDGSQKGLGHNTTEVWVYR